METRTWVYVMVFYRPGFMQRLLNDVVPVRLPWNWIDPEATARCCGRHCAGLKHSVHSVEAGPPAVCRSLCLWGRHADFLRGVTPSPPQLWNSVTVLTAPIAPPGSTDTTLLQPELDTKSRVTPVSLQVTGQTISGHGIWA